MTSQPVLKGMGYLQSEAMPSLFRLSRPAKTLVSDSLIIAQFWLPGFGRNGNGRANAF